MNRLLIPVLGASLALAACNTREATRTPGALEKGSRYVSLDASLDSRSGADPRLSSASAAPDPKVAPVVVLPAWIGRPRQLREHDDADAFEQVISLDLTPRGVARENLVMVSMPRSHAASERLVDGSARIMGRPTEAGIRSELEAVFPGIPMQVATRPASNSYGPYGLAIGRSARGARCLYAWQWIEQAPAIEPRQGAGHPLSLRVHLCRNDITLEAMAAAVNQLRLVPRFEGTPIASATRSGRSRRTGARYSAPRLRYAASVPTPRIAYAPAAGVPQERGGPLGQRYLGTNSGPSAAATMRDALAASVPAVPPSANTVDLPPEAYRGPASRQPGPRP